METNAPANTRVFSRFAGIFVTETALPNRSLCYPLMRQIESPRPARKTVAESGLGM